MAETDVFVALADPTRRRLVEVMHDGESSVTELAEHVDIEQPGVSRHLRILKDAGFVNVRADGRRRMYSLRPEPFEELAEWMRRYAHEEVDRVERLAAFVEDSHDQEEPR
ncbi:ArsR/SmtB family transcription factor [Halopelagius fulvigenes]|uniref:ArsR/SmtB family transcription factor n=1 Tax=Halopelagius fulvigenes TaxID=1198324 RepID=A0ABD5TXD2_9EURY